MKTHLKIQLASDLHLEFLQKFWPGERLIEPISGADVLVLAGDIANGVDALQLFSSRANSRLAKQTPIIYVAGNHEFYGHAIEPMRKKMREAAAVSGIHFLENESVEIHGVRFLGSTLWTDYRLTLENTQVQSMELAQRGLYDHQIIQCEGRRFSPQDALNRHETARSWLAAELSKPFAGKTVVVSHHGPHPMSVHPRHAANPLSSAFVSDLSALLPHVDLWLHGHTHDSFDYQVGRCRVVANPAGYVKNRGVARGRDEFVFENERFDKNLLLELPQ